MVQAFPYLRDVDKWKLLGSDNDPKMTSLEQRECSVDHHRSKCTKTDRSKQDHKRIIDD